MALAQLAAAMAPPPADPLAVARGLSEAVELGAWLSVAELARLLERRKDGAAVRWRVTAASD